MENKKSFLKPAALFVAGAAAGAIVATAFVAVRKLAAKVAQFIPGASVPADTQG